MKKLKLFQTAEFMKQQMLQYANMMFDELPPCKAKAVVIYAKCLSGVLLNIEKGEYAWYLPVSDNLALYWYQGKCGCLPHHLEHLIFYQPGYHMRGLIKYCVSLDKQGMRVDIIDGWNMSDIGSFLTDENKIFTINEALGTPTRIKISTYDNNDAWSGFCRIKKFVVDGNDLPLGWLNGITEKDMRIENCNNDENSYSFTPKLCFLDMFAHQISKKQLVKYFESFKYPYKEDSKDANYNNIVWGVPIQYTDEGFIWVLASKANADTPDNELCSNYLSLVKSIQDENHIYPRTYSGNDMLKEVNPAPVVNVDVDVDIKNKLRLNNTINMEAHHSHFEDDTKQEKEYMKTIEKQKKMIQELSNRLD